MFGHSSLTIDDMNLLLEIQSLPARFCVCCRSNSLCCMTESLKASMQEKMMKMQNDLKTNRKQCPVFSMMIETAALLFLRPTSFS